MRIGGCVSYTRNEPKIKLLMYESWHVQTNCTKGTSLTVLTVHTAPAVSTVSIARTVSTVRTVLILKSLAVDGFIKRVTVNLSRTHLEVK